MNRKEDIQKLDICADMFSYMNSKEDIQKLDISADMFLDVSSNGERKRVGGWGRERDKGGERKRV